MAGSVFEPTLRRWAELEEPVMAMWGSTTDEGALSFAERLTAIRKARDITQAEVTTHDREALVRAIDAFLGLHAGRAA